MATWTPEMRAKAREIGRRGGLTTLARYGRDHFSRAGKISFRVNLKRKKELAILKQSKIPRKTWTEDRGKTYAIVTLPDDKKFYQYLADAAKDLGRDDNAVEE